MMWRTWFIIGSAVAVVLAYRVFVVLNRDIPGDIEKPNVVRWLDEAGRIGNTLVGQRPIILKRVSCKVRSYSNREARGICLLTSD